MKVKYFVYLILFLSSLTSHLHAQVREVDKLWEEQQDSSKNTASKPMYLEMTQDEATQLLNRQPDFGMYKDNYFITGVPTNKSINSQTADAKFQISIRQRLFNSLMPYNTHLMLIYTQKSFWDIYDESAPFDDSNYNPGLLLTKPIIDKNKLKGIVAFSIEHESNGRDSIDNRSWNYFTLSGTYFFNYYFSTQAKVWHGKLGQDNTDLYDYRGYGLIALNFRNKNDRLTASLVINPTKSFSINTQVDLSYRLNKRANQSLFIQWYNGYGESLLDYNQYTSMIRVGMLIKSPLQNQY